MQTFADCIILSFTGSWTVCNFDMGVEIRFRLGELPSGSVEGVDIAEVWDE